MAAHAWSSGKDEGRLARLIVSRPSAIAPELTKTTSTRERTSLATCSTIDSSWGLEKYASGVVNVLVPTLMTQRFDSLNGCNMRSFQFGFRRFHQSVKTVTF